MASVDSKAMAAQMRMEERLYLVCLGGCLSNPKFKADFFEKIDVANTPSLLKDIYSELSTGGDKVIWEWLKQMKVDSDGRVPMEAIVNSLASIAKARSIMHEANLVTSAFNAGNIDQCLEAAGRIKEKL